MAERARNNIRLISEISTIASALITFVGLLTTAFLTTASVLVSLPKPPIILSFNFYVLSEYLQQQELFIRGFLFFIAEFVNALFFGFLFNWLHRRYRNRIIDAFLFAFVIISTAFISMLFIKAIVFRGEMSLQKIAFFCVLYFLSWIITSTLFFVENSVDQTRGEDFVERILGKVGSVAGQLSFIFLLVMYAIFFLMVMVEYVWTGS